MSSERMLDYSLIKNQLDYYLDESLKHLKYKNGENYDDIRILLMDVIDFIASRDYLAAYLTKLYFTNSYLFDHVLKCTFFVSIIASKMNLINNDTIDDICFSCLFFDSGFIPLIESRNNEFSMPTTEEEIEEYKSHTILGIVEASKYLRDENEFINMVINYHHLYKDPKYNDLSSKIFVSFPETFDSNIIDKLYNNPIFQIIQVINNFDKLIKINENKGYSLNNTIVIKYLLNNLSEFYHGIIKIIFEYLSPHKVGTKLLIEDEKFEIIKFNIDNTKPVIQSLTDGRILDTQNTIENFDAKIIQ